MAPDTITSVPEYLGVIYQDVTQPLGGDSLGVP